MFYVTMYAKLQVEFTVVEIPLVLSKNQKLLNILQANETPQKIKFFKTQQKAWYDVAKYKRKGEKIKIRKFP